MKSAQDSKYK